MKNKIFLTLSFIGLISLMVSCAKDETKVVMLTEPVVPKILTFPDMSLVKDHAKDTLTFTATPVDPGFKVSANYFLEACVSGNGFKAAATMRIYFAKQDTLMTITVEALNKLLVAKKFVAGVETAVDFRVRGILSVDAGTGAPGSSTNPLEYKSEIYTQNVVSYTP